jgi:hypothetical protein
MTDDRQCERLTLDETEAMAELARADAARIDQAYRRQTGGTLALWFVNFAGSLIYGFTVADKDGNIPSIVILGITGWLTIVTAAYIAEETRRVHRRIDGLLKMIEKK